METPNDSAIRLIQEEAATERTEEIASWLRAQNHGPRRAALVDRLRERFSGKPAEPDPYDRIYDALESFRDEDGQSLIDVIPHEEFERLAEHIIAEAIGAPEKEKR